MFLLFLAAFSERKEGLMSRKDRKRVVAAILAVVMMLTLGLSSVFADDLVSPVDTAQVQASEAPAPEEPIAGETVSANEESAAEPPGAEADVPVEAEVQEETVSENELDEDAIYVVGGASVLSVDASQKISGPRKIRRADQVGTDSESAAVPVPAHHKSITTLNADEDSYMLTLDVTGQKQTIEGEKPKVDVLLIIDRSGSMAYGMSGNQNPSRGSSRMAVLKSVVNGEDGLVESVLGDSAKDKMDAQMAVVTYSGSKGSNDGAYNDAWTLQGWTSDKSAVTGSVDSISASGGTNCEAGLRTGAGVLESARSDAQKYVIFLTDGLPTFFYANGSDYYYNRRGGKQTYPAGKTLGDGNEDNFHSDRHVYDEDGNRIDAEGICSSRAYDQLAAIRGLTGFYSIAFSSGGSTDFTTGMLAHTDAANKASYSAYSTEELKDVFDQIQQSITSLTLKNVRIADTLSDMARIDPAFATPDTEGAVEYHIRDASGNPIDNEAEEIANAFDSTTLGETVTTKFREGYELNPSWTYSVSFRIKPTAKAYETMFANAGKENPYEGAGTNDGFYSNAGASITYDYGDATEITSDYTETPTFPLAMRDLPIQKEWLNEDGTEMSDTQKEGYLAGVDSIKFTLKGVDKSIAEEDIHADTHIVTRDFALTKDSSWTGTMTVPRNYFKYSIEEDAQFLKEHDFQMTISPATWLDGSTEEAFSFTVTNTSTRKIVVTGVRDQGTGRAAMQVIFLTGLFAAGYMGVRRRRYL